MKIVLYSILAFLCPVCISFAQSPPANIRPLMIGDTLPRGIVLKNVLNHPVSKIQLDDYRGKAVILDFWATYCGTCVESFPTVQKMQDEFKGELLVLPITDQHKATVQSFIRTNRHVKNTRLPFVHSDTLLKKYFPYNSLPHQVWVNKNGVIKAITYEDGFTKANLSKFVGNEDPKVAFKHDKLTFDRNARLKANMDNMETSLIYETTFTHYLPGVSTSLRLLKDSLNRKFRLQYYNMPLVHLYGVAVKGLQYNRIVLEGVDTTAFIKPDDDVDWRKRMLFCAEISFPDSIASRKGRTSLKYTLDTYLQARSYFDMRKAKVLSMVIMDTAKITVSKGGMPFHNLLDKTVQIKTFSNCKLSELVDAMNTAFSNEMEKTIVVDETGYQSLVNISLNVKDLVQIDMVRNELNKHGIDLIENERQVSMFVIKKLEE